MPRPTEVADPAVLRAVVTRLLAEGVWFEVRPKKKTVAILEAADPAYLARVVAECQETAGQPQAGVGDRKGVDTVDRLS